jgi:hypothetical protein
MLPESWWDRWLDPTVEGTQELVDAAVQAALPVAAGLYVYEDSSPPISPTATHTAPRRMRRDRSEELLISSTYPDGGARLHGSSELEAWW